MTALSVTLDEVLAAASLRAASLVPETSGYLALAIGDATARLPFRVDDRKVTLSTEGTVAVARGSEVIGPAEAAACVRGILARLLASSAGSMPGLANAARPRAESEAGIDGFVRELEAALIPVNRAAARRALARLARETVKARESGKLKRARASVRAPAPAFAPGTLVGLAPALPASTAVTPHAAAPAAAPVVAAASPAPTPPLPSPVLAEAHDDGAAVLFEAGTPLAAPVAVEPAGEPIEVAPVTPAASIAAAVAPVPPPASVAVDAWDDEAIACGDAPIAEPVAGVAAMQSGAPAEAEDDDAIEVQFTATPAPVQAAAVWAEPAAPLPAVEPTPTAIGGYAVALLERVDAAVEATDAGDATILDGALAVEDHGREDEADDWGDHAPVAAPEPTPTDAPRLFPSDVLTAPLRFEIARPAAPVEGPSASAIPAPAAEPDAAEERHAAAEEATAGGEPVDVADGAAHLDAAPAPATAEPGVVATGHDDVAAREESVACAGEGAAAEAKSGVAEGEHALPAPVDAAAEPASVVATSDERAPARAVQPAPRTETRETPAANTAGVADLGRAPTSSVDDLLSRFHDPLLGDEHGVRLVRASLKQLAGLDPTAPPPAVRPARLALAPTPAPPPVTRASTPPALTPSAPPAPRRPGVALWAALLLLGLAGTGAIWRLRPDVFGGAPAGGRTCQSGPNCF